METKNFFLINLQVIIAASICDGNIDESEMKKIQSYVEKETISSSVAIKLAAQDQIKLSKQDPVIYCNKILQEINNASLTLAEKIYITNSAIETVRIDGLMLSEEIKFIKSEMIIYQLIKIWLKINKIKEMKKINNYTIYIQVYHFSYFY